MGAETILLSSVDAVLADPAELSDGVSIEQSSAFNFSPVETVWTSRLDSPHISYKQAVYNSTSNAVLLLGYLNIETLVRAGVLYEILLMMKRENLKIMFLSETKVCENTYKCGEFFIFTSGVKGDKHGVGVILHVSLLSSVTAVQAYSSWQIAVQLKITGGRLTLLRIYCPHDGVDVETRERFFDELNEATTNYAKAGPVIACGELNTHLKYRYAEESAFFGPHLFDCQGPPAVQTVDTNRDLLAQYCSATGMAVKNTFLHKSTHQQITFYDRRGHTPMGAFDPRWHRQLDLLLCSSDYLPMVHDIISRPDIRVGPTTHHLQIAKLHIPIRKTEAPPKKKHGKYRGISGKIER